MKIRKIEICGFKSFVDPTFVLFDHDVTAVVGPNGCGKSNIVDAIRWSMGEQSAKTLRGKAMEDVIFNGCETRGPHAFAEVSVTFDNVDGLSPPEYRDYPEITVTRRLDRDGVSDYLINRVPVRLLDVTNLFLGTGVGKRAYSIIEQGRIGFIVTSKPEDRRHLIEEAAGITKFKARKLAAERKMDHTRQNLLRVGDIVAEIERTVATLKRQAHKAERYRTYRNEVRDLELLVASHRWLELTSTQKVVACEFDDASANVAEIRSALEARDAEIETARVAAEVEEAAVDRAQTLAYELDNQVRIHEGTLENLKERLKGLRDAEEFAEREIAALAAKREELRTEQESLALVLGALEAAERKEQDALAVEVAELDRRRATRDEAEEAAGNARARVVDADARIARAEAVLGAFTERRDEARARIEKLLVEREALETRAREIEEERSALQGRFEGLTSGRAETAQRRTDLEGELARLRDEIRASDTRVDTLRELLSEKRSRLRSLEELQTRFEGVGAGVKAVMTRHASDPTTAARVGIVGLLADRLECRAEFTRALAGVLGERLQYVVVERPEAAHELATFLRAEDLGRATFVPRSVRRVVRAAPRALAIEGVVGYLADEVRASSEDRALVEHLLDGVLVVEDLDAAARVRASGGSTGPVVTLHGEVLWPDGALTGGSGENVGAHLLDVKREIRELHELVARVDGELSVAVTRHGELRRAIASRQAAIEATRTETHGTEIAIVKAEKDIRSAEDEHARLQIRAAVIASEVTELGHRVATTGEEENAARKEAVLARAAKIDAAGALESAEAVVRERRAEVDLQSGRVTEVKVRAVAAEERAEGHRSAVLRLERSVEELDAQRQRFAQEALQAARGQGETVGNMFRTHEELEVSVEEARFAHEALAARRASYDAAKERIGREEGALRQLRAEIDAKGARVNALTVRERELAMQIEHLLDHIADRHRIDLTKVIGDYHCREIPDDGVRARIEELVRLIERMGEINLTAIDEYEEQSKRYEHLKAQKDDLEQALAKLDRAIRQMNRESRKLFRAAFDAVNERFKRVFPQMFGGGRAELRLTNAEDMLETGIDIIAQPPGKKLGSLELMSGGEKALTAVSLVFALFQYRPSPFCLLDEVDAPLDEANIGRFCEAIRQMTSRSQFILITHAKRTMELADVLYGVTMETPGISKLVSVELRGRARTPDRPQARDAVAVA